MEGEDGKVSGGKEGDRNERVNGWEGEGRKRKGRAGQGEGEERGK